MSLIPCCLPDLKPTNSDTRFTKLVRPPRNGGFSEYKTYSDIPSDNPLFAVICYTTRYIGKRQRLSRLRRHKVVGSVQVEMSEWRKFQLFECASSPAHPMRATTVRERHLSTGSAAYDPRPG